jgi:uncharacterized protein with HEPN domain
MMRDAQRITHMLGFVRRSLQILDGVDREQYLSSLGLQEQLELNMIHLGEAAARISEDIRESHLDIPWHEMVGMRNVLTHEYFRIKPIILFDTVMSEFERLEQNLDRLQDEYPV